ncbi:hypothetical protein SAMN04488056_11421 [Cohaesibacter marisflavi]|uniref:Uncharacterized protein n=1 Tax=Cohaesibacter marisflavi TaxID=655353 RepID=A0A1I5KI74_9HYPH|nr:hypothetical protein [Cohaesibacter marisflavi]SFO84708.1 hypothetical protein SAMN04488056_11421 [Cohaesibacter marisflavi]
MATTTKHKFYIVDLVRNKPKSEFIEVPAFRVDIEFEVTTKGKTPAPESLLKRLEEDAREVLEGKEAKIKKLAFDAAEEIDGLMKVRPVTQDTARKVQIITAITNKAIRALMASAEAEAKKVAQDRLKKEARNDSNLTEARVKTVVKWGKSLLKISTSVGRLVATSGADVSAYIAIAKALKVLYADFKEQMRDEEKLRKVLDSALTDFAKHKGELTKKKQEADKKLASFASKAEKARKDYRNNVTKTRHSTDNLSKAAGKIQAKMKAAATIKEGVKIGAECMKLKGQVRVLATRLDKQETFLDYIEDALKDLGAKVDDKTLLERIKALDRKTIQTEAKNVKGILKSITSAVEEFAT